LNQALTAFQRAAQIGWKSISEEARRRLTADKAWWSDFTTRDYMRAEADLARLRWKRQQYAEALRGYRKLLRLNPGDNQGIRYCLLCCALEAGDWAAAEKIFAQYLRDEENAISLYSRALLAFVKQDDQPDARAALLAAFAANAHVPELLLTGGDDLLALPLGPYSHGSQMEALMYFQMAVKSWRQQPHAFAWLRRAARKSTLLK
jgi:tetratricopeptide (TPR) repeat protein